jgi:hypothetical protein
MTTKMQRLRQNGRILARLREGPATNIELEQCSGSKRVNSRIADVRRFYSYQIKRH